MNLPYLDLILKQLEQGDANFEQAVVMPIGVMRSRDINGLATCDRTGTTLFF